jgi:hypothetical protein
MPAKIERCVKQVKAQGKSDDSAWAICSKSTGIKRGKGGTWVQESGGFYSLFVEESKFDQTPYVKKAMKWLEAKWPKEKFNFTFKHNPKLTGDLKRYYASIDGVEFEIAGKAFDTTGDDEPDTVVFKINPVEDDDEVEGF